MLKVLSKITIKRTPNAFQNKIVDFSHASKLKLTNSLLNRSKFN